MDMDQIRSRVECCCCSRLLDECGTKHINGVQLNYAAKWKSPVCGNVISGSDGTAMAFVCDECLAAEKPISFAVEFRGDTVVYHPVETLDPAPLCLTHLAVLDIIIHRKNGSVLIGDGPLSVAAEELVDRKMLSRVSKGNRYEITEDGRSALRRHVERN